MANEAEIINNPDSTPGAVSTGYQAQNTNLVAQRTGIDKTYVSGGVGTVTVEISGPVDVNGVLYDIKSQTVLTPPSAGRYYITLQGAGPQYLTPTLGTSAGTFDPLKNARYDTNNYRVLNWVIYFDGTDCYVNRLLTPESEHTEIEDLDTPEEIWITANGNWVAKRSKYYLIYITGCGQNGGRAVDGTFGVAGSTGIKRIWIDAGDTWTAAFTTGSGNAATFTDGVTTLSAGNEGGAISGCDITHIGGGGHVRNSSILPSPYFAGWNGGASFWGDGGRLGQAGVSYGSGAGATTTLPAALSGKQGVIRIVG